MSPLERAVRLLSRPEFSVLTAEDVAAAIREAVAAERERCAKVVEATDPADIMSELEWSEADNRAAARRLRGIAARIREGGAA